MTDNTRSHNAIPLPLFFSKPAKDQVRLSPQGKWLAYRSRDATTGVLNLWVQDMATGVAQQLTWEQDRDVCMLYWFTYDDKSIVYLREPQRGLELYHLYAMDLPDNTATQSTKSIKPAEPRDLIGDLNTTCAMGFAGGLQVWLDPNQPRHVYTGTAPCGIRGNSWSVTKIHIDTCEKQMVAQNPLGGSWLLLAWFVVQSLFAAVLRLLGLATVEDQPRAIVQWFPDHNMQFRGRLEVSLLDLSCAWRVQPKSINNNNNHHQQQQPWKRLHFTTWANANMSLVGSSGGSGTAHFDFSDNGQFVDLHVCNKADTTSWERYDIQQGQHVQQLACHPQSDITGFLRHPTTRAVQAVKYNYEKPMLQCLPDCPDHVKNDLDFLQNHFPAAAVSIVSRTLDDLTWVIHAQSDVGLSACLGSPSGYFVLHRQEEEGLSTTSSSSLEFLLSPQPALKDYSLGTMQAVHIPTRDGKDLLCYLSRPPTSSSTKVHTSTETTLKTPLVLLIHGGPQARDVWQFHPLCQLLGNRGMSVLQVNYRGSTGMGTQFMKLGMDGAFATGVQDDIEDAAQFAIEKEWCSPDRIAIMGGSFGGYCTLSALTYRMTLSKQRVNFQCAVSICPPSIVGKANPHKAFYGNPLIARYWRQVYGSDISDNLEASKEVSPLFHVGKVQCPLLLLHGEDDPRVPIGQTNDLFQKLMQQQKPQPQTAENLCEYIRFAKEGHGIQKEQNILYMYHCVERFLCRHLKLPEPPVLEDSWVKGHTGTHVSVQEATASTKNKKV